MRTNCCHSKSFRSENQSIVCLNQSCHNYLGLTDSFSYRTFNRFTSVLLFAFILCFCENDYSSVNHDKSEIEATSYLNRKKNIACNKETLKAEIKDCKIICPDEVYAQIMIESGHMTSFLFKRANNLLGMRYPFKRMTTAVGIYLPDEDAIIKGTQEELKKYAKRNHYAVFETWQDCVNDYKLWQDECFKLTDRYLGFLGKYYAEDTQYIAKIKSITR